MKIVPPLILFLDENHCGNRHLLNAIENQGIRCEKHLDHFPAGTEDTLWLPEIGRRSWCLLTTDASIRRKFRSNYLEREAVRIHGVRMFYFSRNQLSGAEMGIALTRALPAIRRLFETQPAPFTASISRNGEVQLRDTF
jgi:hypothetical protein